MVLIKTIEKKFKNVDSILRILKASDDTLHYYLTIGDDAFFNKMGVDYFTIDEAIKAGTLAMKYQVEHMLIKQKYNKV